MHPSSFMCRTRFPAGSARSCGSRAPRAAAEAAGVPGGAGRRARGASSGSTGKERGVDPPPRASGQPRGRRHFRRGGRSPGLIPRPARRLRPPPAGPGAVGTGEQRLAAGGASAAPRLREGSAAAAPLRSARGSSGFSRVHPAEPVAQPELSSWGVQHLCMCFIGTSVVFDGAQAKRASTSLSSLNIFSRGLACKRVKCSRQSKLTIAG